MRPYSQLLNTSSWLIAASDVDPALSDPEWLAFVLVHGDHMAVTGEVTGAALRAAPYWFDRTDAECAAFAAAAARSPRPDADAWRAVAAALPWLRQLSHERLRPAPLAAAYRPIPGTGLLVRRDLEDRPPALLAEWRRAATATVARFHAAWRPADPAALSRLLDWLAVTAPPVLVCAQGRIVWDPDAPARIGPLRSRLRGAAGAAVRDINADLTVAAARTRAFLGALADPAALPRPDPRTEQSGYVYLHRERALLAYDLHEPGIERLAEPALPYGRAMLGARAVHEWAHLAVDAGWVPRVTGPAEADAALEALADGLAAAVAAASPAVRAHTAADLDALVAATPGLPAAASPADRAGAALARLLCTRLPDYQANLLARRFLTLAERETYIRHNVRTLRPFYPPTQLWRMLVRYLYEYQYLRFSLVPDPYAFFVRSTWLDADLFRTGALDEARFVRLAALVGRLCESHAVDETRFRPVAPPEAAGEG